MRKLSGMHIKKVKKPGKPVLRMMVETIGSVVVFLQRYFRIVHANIRRKYYREWMTVVGAVMP